jgi:hypothetical protein
MTMIKIIIYPDGTTGIINTIRIEGEYTLPAYDSLKDLKGSPPTKRIPPPDHRKRGPRYRKKK